jgi:hypothetical protein
MTKVSMWFDEPSMKSTYRNIPRVPVKDTSVNVEVLFVSLVPDLPTARLLLLVNQPVDRLVLRVDRDLVTVLHQSDWPSHSCLGRDMTWRMQLFKRHQIE